MQVTPNRKIAVWNATVSDQITLNIHSLEYYVFQLACPKHMFTDKFPDREKAFINGFESEVVDNNISQNITLNYTSLFT